MENNILATNTALNSNVRSSLSGKLGCSLAVNPSCKGVRIEEQIAALVKHAYQELRVNCAQTVLLTLGDIFSVSISKQLLNSGIGLNGAGRRQEQCGLIEGALMFMGIYFSEYDLSPREIVDICGRFVDAFKTDFGSISCRDLRPGGFRKEDPPHRCRELSLQSIAFSEAFIRAEAVRIGIL